MAGFGVSAPSFLGVDGGGVGTRPCMFSCFDFKSSVGSNVDINGGVPEANHVVQLHAKLSDSTCTALAASADRATSRRCQHIRLAFLLHHDDAPL